MPTPRERAREQTLAEITKLGRDQLATVGAAQLSVRSIARDLGVVSSAVYRYVKSRDDLLTLLVVDAYDEVGDLAEAAVARRRPHDHAGRFRAFAHAVRDWGVAEPARYGLVFGTPVTGYAAPAELTTAPGTRIPLLLMRLVTEAVADGAIAESDGPALPKALRGDLARMRSQLGGALSDDLIARGMLAWTSVFGAVGFEVFGQYGADALTAPRQLFEHHLDRILELIGLTS